MIVGLEFLCVFVHRPSNAYLHSSDDLMALDFLAGFVLAGFAEVF